MALFTLRVVLATAHRVTTLRRLLASLANLAVFICLIGIGIAAGCLLAASEAIEPRQQDRKHHASRR
jgi:hypothetical protein